MSKSKTYNEGVESGLKVAQKIIEKEVEVMDYLKTKIDLIVDGHDEMKKAVDQLIEDTDENAIARIYGICNSTCPNELKDHEQKMLINIMATLSDLQANEAQKKYCNNLRHHLNVEGYEPNRSYDFRKIESIESVKSIKTIAKAVRIYLFLENFNMDGIYKHEDDLFSHFELRSFDEIDAIIETIYCLFGCDGLIEFYGDFEELGEVDERNLDYLNIEEKEYIEVSNECAQIYFQNCTEYDENRRYIESSSFVIYNDEDTIMCIHKSSGVKKKIMQVEDAGRYFEKKKIASYQDMIYYVMGNDLLCKDIHSMREYMIAHIDEEKNDTGELYEVCNLLVYNGKKLIYQNRYLYIVDFEQGSESVRRISLDFVLGRCHLREDYIYYITFDSDFDYNFNGKTLRTGYQLRRYGIINNQDTYVSRTFGRHDMEHGIKQTYDIVIDGISENRYFCVFEYGTLDANRLGFECFYFNLDSTDASPKQFFIWNAHVFQIEQYKNYLIYVNADKSYSIIKHNFVDDKKKVLFKNYGENAKLPTQLKLICYVVAGKEYLMQPSAYMRLGKWLWIKEKDKITPQILSIC